MERQVKAGLEHQVARCSRHFARSRLGLTHTFIHLKIVSNHHEDYTIVNKLFGLHVLSNQEQLGHYVIYLNARPLLRSPQRWGRCPGNVGSCHEVNYYSLQLVLFQKWARIWLLL